MCRRFTQFIPSSTEGEAVSPKYQTGDWVRFYQAGTLVIGVVEYIRDGFPHALKPEYYTNVGVVVEDRILEVRAPVTAEETP